MAKGDKGTANGESAKGEKIFRDFGIEGFGNLVFDRLVSAKEMFKGRKAYPQMQVALCIDQPILRTPFFRRGQKTNW